MPNPYKYTNEELDDFVDEWHRDDSIVMPLRGFLMWQTRFNENEVEHWLRTGVLPRATT